MAMHSLQAQQDDETRPRSCLQALAKVVTELRRRAVALEAKRAGALAAPP